jgi:hypothetical protein
MISERYYPAMASPVDISARTVAEMVVQLGCLTRKRSKIDGRSIDFTLAYNLRKLLAEDPFEALVDAASVLSNSASRTVERGLERMMHKMAQQQGKHYFGMCPNCKYFQGEGYHANGEPNYCCTLVDEPLKEAEKQQLCVNFLPGR